MTETTTASDQSGAQNLLALADLMTPHAIRVAATLRLADHIDKGDTTVDALARATDTDPAILALLVSLLAELGVLTQEPLAVTELGAALRSDHPISVARYLSNDGLFGRSELGLAGLAHTVRTGEPAYPAAFGRNYWDDINSSSEFVDALVEEGPKVSAWDADLVFDAYDWSSVRHVTDVGGNNGTLLIDLLGRHPHLHGTSFDLQNVATIAADRISQSPVANRADAVVGSFFESVPRGSDVYLLSGILADWSDEDAVKILSTVRDSLGDGGAVLLAEISVAVTGSAALALSVAATMPAPVRTAEQIEAIAAAAGFDVTWTGPHTALRSLYELRPAATAKGR